MKSSPGLQAVRDRAERVLRTPKPPHGTIALAKDVLKAVDLIETLAGALERITQPGENNCDCVNCRRLARAALDKYRSFGDGAT